MHLPSKVGNTFALNRLSFFLPYSPLLADSYDTTYGIDCSPSRPAYQFNDPILYVALGAVGTVAATATQKCSNFVRCVVCRMNDSSRSAG